MFSNFLNFVGFCTNKPLWQGLAMNLPATYCRKSLCMWNFVSWWLWQIFSVDHISTLHARFQGSYFLVSISPHKSCKIPLYSVSFSELCRQIYNMYECISTVELSDDQFRGLSVYKTFDTHQVQTVYVYI